MWTTIDPVQPAFRWIASTGLLTMAMLTTVPFCGVVQTQRLSVWVMTSGGAMAGATSSVRCWWVFAGLLGLGARLDAVSVWAAAAEAVAARAAAARVRARAERCKDDLRESGGERLPQGGQTRWVRAVGWVGGGRGASVRGGPTQTVVPILGTPDAPSEGGRGRSGDDGVAAQGPDPGRAVTRPRPLVVHPRKAPQPVALTQHARGLVRVGHQPRGVIDDGWCRGLAPFRASDRRTGGRAVAQPRRVCLGKPPRGRGCASSPIRSHVRLRRTPGQDVRDGVLNGVRL